MLQKLIIKNYALIKELHIEPDACLNTITGETGAGKSIMLGAVGLLLGKRADTKVLYEEDEKCIVEGTFNIKNYTLASFFEDESLDYEEECIIRREISASGKSRAFVNDTPVTLDVLKTLGNYLMDVHSQHQTLLLGDQDFQLQFIDAFTGSKEKVAAYQMIYSSFRKAEKALKNYQDNSEKLQQERDFNQFQFDELEKAQLETGEQEVLEERLKVLENGEFIQQKLTEADNILEQSEYAANNSLHDAVEALRAIQEFSEVYKVLFERLNSTFIEVQDIAGSVEKQNNQFEHNPGDLAETQDRLSLIYQLQQKHHVDTISALHEVKHALDNKLAETQDAEQQIVALEKELGKQSAALHDAGNTLSAQRQGGFKPIEQELTALLADLGMADASVKIQHQKIAPHKSGFDDISILFSANKGIAPQPLKSVASGGEFSRLMFALKFIMADKIAMPTIIFDEIDTGISGEIAIKMVNMMLKMAQNHQVITISHLPQIAAKGHKHYYVYKDNSADKSVSKIKLLNNEKRVLAIAQMIGGDQPSESAIKSAQELLAS